MENNMGNILGLAVGGAIALKFMDVALDKRNNKKKSKKKLKKVI